MFWFIVITLFILLSIILSILSLIDNFLGFALDLVVNGIKHLVNGIKYVVLFIIHCIPAIMIFIMEWMLMVEIHNYPINLPFFLVTVPIALINMITARTQSFAVTVFLIWLPCFLFVIVIKNIILCFLAAVGALLFLYFIVNRTLYKIGISESLFGEKTPFDYVPMLIDFVIMFKLLSRV